VAHTLPFAPVYAAYCSSQLLEICVRVAHGTAPLWRGGETGACGRRAASFCVYLILAGDWTCLEQCGRGGAVDVAAGAGRWLLSIYVVGDVGRPLVAAVSAIVIRRAVRKSRNHRQCCDLGRVPWFLVIAVIFGWLCIRSRHIWGFSGANLALQ